MKSGGNQCDSQLLSVPGSSTFSREIKVKGSNRAIVGNSITRFRSYYLTFLHHLARGTNIDPYFSSRRFDRVKFPIFRKNSKILFKEISSRSIGRASTREKEYEESENSGRKCRNKCVNDWERFLKMTRMNAKFHGVMFFTMLVSRFLFYAEKILGEILFPRILSAQIQFKKAPFPQHLKHFDPSIEVFVPAIVYVTRFPPLSMTFDPSGAKWFRFDFSPEGKASPSSNEG